MITTKKINKNPGIFRIFDSVHAKISYSKDQSTEDNQIKKFLSAYQQVVLYELRNLAKQNLPEDNETQEKEIERLRKLITDFQKEKFGSHFPKLDNTNHKFKSLALNEENAKKVFLMLLNSDPKDVANLIHQQKCISNMLCGEDYKKTKIALGAFIFVLALLATSIITTYAGLLLGGGFVLDTICKTAAGCFITAIGFAEAKFIAKTAKIGIETEDTNAIQNKADGIKNINLETKSCKALIKAAEKLTKDVVQEKVPLISP
jgi:hypothetical protein